jgi:hypothetical protein
MTNKFGKPKYGQEQFKKTGKPGKGPGNNFIRILPPMFSLEDEGRWAVYRTTHWGYSGVSPADKTKTIVRPFLCIEERDRRSKMTIQECPECTRFNEFKAEADAHEAQLKGEKKDGKPRYSEDQVKELMETRRNWLQKHGPERKWYLNVQLKDGTFGDYKINHKIHKKGIDAKIDELMKDNQIDPLDPSQGVWFNIKRIGNGFDPPDVVEVETEDLIIDGKKVPGAKTIKMAPLSDEDIERCFKECRDLTTLGGTVLSYERIDMLVKSSGDPDEIDRIFGGAVGQGSKSTSGTVVEEDDDGPEYVPPAQTAPKEDSPKRVEITPEMLARREAIRVKQEVEAVKRAQEEASKKAQAEAAKVEKPATAGVNPLDMSDEDYVKFFDGQAAA